MKRTHKLLLVIALILSSFLSGFTYRDLGSGQGAQGVLTALQDLPNQINSVITANLESTSVDLPPVDTYWSVYNYLGSNYYSEKSPEPTELTYAAIRGMLGSLGDRYTRFLDPREYEQMKLENRGDFEGIGAVLRDRDGRIFIENTIENSPAERAGLRAGDIILRVDDELIQGLDILEVVKRIRGPKGTKVKLTIRRDDVNDLIDVDIVRAVVPLEVVKWRMEDEASKIGYIELVQFNEKTSEKLDQALEELESAGMRALVIDLRRNPGGLLEVAVDVGSRFVSRGNIVTIQTRGGRQIDKPAKKSTRSVTQPVVVLIGQGSASASEILAGAIKDHKIGTLIGTDTFGKGLVQTIFEVGQDGSAVTVTIAKYLTPGGQDVTEDKIHPHIKVEPSEQDLREERDVQLERAIEHLRENLGDTHAKSSQSDSKI